MTEVSLNNLTIKDLKLDANTLQELTEELLVKHISEEDIISSIRIDGKDLSYQEEIDLQNKDISSFSTLDFSIISSYEMAVMSLDDCSVYIDTIIEKIHLLCSHYTKNELDLANLQFAEVVEILDLYIQLVSKIFKTIRKRHSERLASANMFQQLDIHLLSIMKAILSAKEKNDIIMLGDLLEYELVDNLTQWKIKAIPQLKNLKEV